MLALYEHIPHEIIDAYINAYGLFMAPPKGDSRVLAILFAYKDGAFTYSGIKELDYQDVSSMQEIFYRSISTMAVSPIPALLVSEQGFKDASGSYGANSRNYKKLTSVLKNCAEADSDLRGLGNLVRENATVIISSIVNKIRAQVQANWILTIQINDSLIATAQYFDEIKKDALSSNYISCYALEREHARKDAYQCVLCKASGITSYGTLSVSKFFASKSDPTAACIDFEGDNPSFLYPVCPTCGEKLDRLKPVLDHNFRFNFGTFNYWVVPDSPSERDLTDTIRAIISKMDQMRNETLHASMLNQNHSENKEMLFDAYSPDIFCSLAQLEERHTVSIVVYHDGDTDSEIKPLVTIEGIKPTVLKQIFGAKREIDGCELFAHWALKNRDRGFANEFRFELIKEFFPINNKKYGDFTISFWETVKHILHQQPLSSIYMMQRIMSMLQKRYALEDNFADCVIRSMMLIKFLSKLQMLAFPRSAPESILPLTQYESFFTKHEEFFAAKANKAVFLIGVLCKLLMDIQTLRNSANPIRNRLSGLKLNLEMIKTLHTEMVLKLREYQNDTFYTLERQIEMLLAKGTFDELTDNEISYLFTLGMTLTEELWA